MQLQLVLKAVLFSTLLVFVKSGWAWFGIFVLMILYFYYHDPWNISRFLSSFLILGAGSLIAFWRLSPQNTLASIIIAVFFGILFFILLGVKNLIFVHRAAPYYFLNSLLFSVVFILFFSTDKSMLFTLKYLLAGFAAFLLFREFLTFNFELPEGSIQSPVLVKKNLAALVFTFLTLELLWVVALLPIGFLNLVSLMLLFILLLEDLLLHNWSGTLTNQIILRNTTFFLLVGLVIFAFSKWTL